MDNFEKIDPFLTLTDNRLTSVNNSLPTDRLVRATRFVSILNFQRFCNCKYFILQISQTVTR